MAEAVTKYKTNRGVLFDTLQEAEEQERIDMLLNTFLNASRLHLSRVDVERGMKAVLAVYHFELRPVPPPLPPGPWQEPE